VVPSALQLVRGYVSGTYFLCPRRKAHIFVRSVFELADQFFSADHDLFPAADGPVLESAAVELEQ
jgi:hypothetical protein